MLMSEDLLNRNKKTLNKTKISLIMIGFLSYIIAMNFNFVIDIWYIFGSIAGSSILIPFLLLLFKPNIKLKYPSLTLIIPILISICWLYYDYPFGMDTMMYPGITVSLGLCLLNKKM